jgi:hypothetical protein
LVILAHTLNNYTFTLGKGCFEGHCLVDNALFLFVPWLPFMGYVFAVYAGAVQFSQEMGCSKMAACDVFINLGLL